MTHVESRLEPFSCSGVRSARERRGRTTLAGGWFLTAVLALGTSVALGACAATELAPSAPNEDGTAVARTSSVELRAQARPSRPDVPSELTPIEVSVKNLAPGAITVALEDIELVAGDARARAIAPETIRLRRPMGLGIDPASPFAAPGAASSVAATDGAARGSSGPNFEPSETYALGADADPRRRELIDGAFTGGAITSGESQRGTLYFDTEELEGDRVNLRVVVRAGADSSVTQVLEIPFNVES